MKPLFRHNEKLVDLDLFLDNLQEIQGDSEDEAEQLDLFDSLGG